MIRRGFGLADLDAGDLAVAIALALGPEVDACDALELWPLEFETLPAMTSP